MWLEVNFRTINLKKYRAYLFDNKNFKPEWDSNTSKLFIAKNRNLIFNFKIDYREDINLDNFNNYFYRPFKPPIKCSKIDFSQIDYNFLLPNEKNKEVSLKDNKTLIKEELIKKGLNKKVINKEFLSKESPPEELLINATLDYFYNLFNSNYENSNYKLINSYGLQIINENAKGLFTPITDIILLNKIDAYKLIFKLKVYNKIDLYKKFIYYKIDEFFIENSYYLKNLFTEYNLNNLNLKNIIIKIIYS